jgi:glycerophosphoryl diester phosphodiesterase
VREALLVIGHRGSAGTAPENTLPSFAAAADGGADMIELDVRLTADGELVVHHDMLLWRTAGLRRRIQELTAAQITRLDAGGWFARRYRGVTVPALASVLAWRPAHLGVNIEVKTAGDSRGSSAYVRPLLKLVDRVPGPRLLVSSFDDTFLALLHREAPALSLGCLYMPVRDRVRGPAGLARATAARVFICSARQSRPALVGEARAAGLDVFVYGVNAVRPARNMRALGVNGIITDVPARLRRSLNRTGCSL